MTDKIIDFLCMVAAIILVCIFLQAQEPETAKVLGVLAMGGLLKMAGVRPGNGQSNPKQGGGL